MVEIVLHPALPPSLFLPSFLLPLFLFLFPHFSSSRMERELAEVRQDRESQLRQLRNKMEQSVQSLHHQHSIRDARVGEGRGRERRDGSGEREGGREGKEGREWREREKEGKEGREEGDKISIVLFSNFTTPSRQQSRSHSWSSKSVTGETLWRRPRGDMSNRPQ